MGEGNGSSSSKRGLGRVVAAEAFAYLRSGLLAPGGARSIRHKAKEASVLRVVFVPGVGGNASQFASIKLALEGIADSFDAFEYTSLSHPQRIAASLSDHLHAAAEHAERIIVIGHSMGGLLLRLVLQGDRPPPRIAAFVSICAPLHGTWRSKLAPNPRLRALAPDSELVREVIGGGHRLRSLNGAVLTIGARYDQFVAPYDSAFLDGHPQLCLEDSGHVASLFDRRVHQAIVELARRTLTSSE